MKFETERTTAGQQYMIPGTERRRLPVIPSYSRDGTQLVIPGAEQVAVRKLLERRLVMPLVPRRGQRPIGATPLFRAKY